MHGTLDEVLIEVKGNHETPKSDISNEGAGNA